MHFHLCLCASIHTNTYTIFNVIIAIIPFRNFNSTVLLTVFKGMKWFPLNHHLVHLVPFHFFVDLPSNLLGPVYSHFKHRGGEQQNIGQVRSSFGSKGAAKWKFQIACGLLFNLTFWWLVVEIIGLHSGSCSLRSTGLSICWSTFYLYILYGHVPGFTIS